MRYALTYPRSSICTRNETAIFHRRVKHGEASFRKECFHLDSQISINSYGKHGQQQKKNNKLLR